MKDLTERSLVSNPTREVRIRGADDKEIVRRIGSGGHIGERALLDRGLRTGTRRVLEDSTVLFVAPRTFSA